MELNADQEAELRSVLKQHPIGIHTDALWEKCKTFSDRQELSLGLHAAKQQGWMYKNGGLHFIVNGEATKECIASFVKPVVEEPAPIATDKEDPWAKSRHMFELKTSSKETFPITPPQPLPEAIQREIDAGNTVIGPGTVMPAPAVIELGSLGFGDLQRSKGLGAAALALYKFRAEEPLCLDDLVELTGTGKTSLYSAMTRLVVERYAEKDDTVFRRPIFRWSGLYRYPFKSSLPTDNDLLKFRTVEDWHNYKDPKNVVEPQKEVECVPPVASDVGPDGVAGELGPSGCPKGISTEHEFKASYTNVPQVESALKVIDAELALHKHQIEALTRLRNILQPPVVPPML